MVSFRKSSLEMCRGWRKNGVVGSCLFGFGSIPTHLAHSDVGYQPSTGLAWPGRQRTDNRLVLPGGGLQFHWVWEGNKKKNPVGLEHQCKLNPCYDYAGKNGTMGTFFFQVMFIVKNPHKNLFRAPLDQCFFSFPSWKGTKECPLNKFTEGKFLCVSGEANQDMSLSISGLMKEKFLNMFWSILLISALSASNRRGFSFEISLSKLLQSYGDFTLGWKGGSVSFLSSSSQLISWNIGCWWASPLTLSLFSGFLTKSFTKRSLAPFSSHRGVRGVVHKDGVEELFLILPTEWWLTY